MDAESLAQVEKVVTTAVNGVEKRLRKEFSDKFGEINDRFGEINDKFGKINDRFGEINVKFGEINDRFGEINEKFEKVGEKFEEAKRHRGALYEDTLHRIDLVVEGHQALHQKIEDVEARLTVRIEHEAVETRALMQLSYRQLQDRVETLEQRVQLIEKRLGLLSN